MKTKNYFSGLLMGILVALTMSLIVSKAASAAELNDVKLPDEFTVDGTKLSVNCLGMRKVEKFGFPIKVYVGGLYLEHKSSDSDAIIGNDEKKIMIMHFVRSLDRDQLVEAFQSGLENGCVVACDKHSAQWALLSSHIVSVRADNEIKFTFYKDKIDYEVNGPNAQKVTIAGSPDAAALSKNLLSMFINKKKPPTEEFRKGVLCIK
jgi:hypothetical protein